MTYRCEEASATIDALLFGSPRRPVAAAAGELGPAALAESDPASLPPDLHHFSQHLKSCAKCRRAFGGAVAIDRRLRSTFDALEQTLQQPSSAAASKIIESACQAPDAARWVRRIRRPVNTILWLTFFAFLSGALACLAWALYRLIEAQGR
jgi:hypothetical protein